MKNLKSYKTALKVTLSTILVTSIFMGCNNSPKEKLDEATTEVVDASADLVKANEEYMTEVANYKADIAQKIAANEESIKEYTLKLAKKKNATLKKKVAELEQKTKELKQKIEDFKAEGSKESWSNFKVEFDHDMDGLGKAFNDLTIQNTKK